MQGYVSLQRCCIFLFLISMEYFNKSLFRHFFISAMLKPVGFGLSKIVKDCTSGNERPVYIDFDP